MECQYKMETFYKQTQAPQLFSMGGTSEVGYLISSFPHFKNEKSEAKQN